MKIRYKKVNEEGYSEDKLRVISGLPALKLKNVTTA